MNNAESYTFIKTIENEEILGLRKFYLISVRKQREYGIYRKNL